MTVDSNAGATARWGGVAQSPADWFGPAAGLAAGLAYLVGYLEVAFFASALEVTPRDLGLDFRDYLVLSAVNLFFLAMATGGFALASHLEASRPTELRKRLIGESSSRGMKRLRTGGVELIRAFSSAFVLTYVGVWLGLSSGLAAVVVLPIVGLVVLGSLTLGTRASLAMLGAALIAAVLVSFYAADGYAHDLRQAVRTNGDTPMPPVALRSVLQPERGTALSGLDSTCAVRVAGSVFLGSEAVAVAEMDRFTIEQCPLDRAPFASATP